VGYPRSGIMFGACTLALTRLKGAAVLRFVSPAGRPLRFANRALSTLTLTLTAGACAGYVSGGGLTQQIAPPLPSPPATSPPPSLSSPAPPPSPPPSPPPPPPPPACHYDVVIHATAAGKFTLGVRLTEVQRSKSGES
jgi:hypothetical protein